MNQSQFFEQARARLIRTQTQASVDPIIATEIVDVAIHAANSALDSVERICSASRYGIAATAIAVQLLAMQMEMATAAVRKMAKDDGLKFVEADLSLKGNKQ